MTDDRRRRSAGARGRGSQRRSDRRPPRPSPRSSPPSGSPRPERALEPERGPVRGTCADFCPAAELRERQRAGELSRFERAAGGGQARVVAVKKFRRAAAGVEAAADAGDVRPPRVLLDTLRHLFQVVLPLERGGFGAAEEAEPREFLALYEFVSDRVRSVRQDFTVQHVQDEALEAALEQIARFHTIAGLRATQLLSKDPREKLAHQWSDKLNDEQLSSALAQLQELYREKHAQPSAAGSDERGLDRQAEFVAYDLLLRIDDPGSTSLTLRRLPRCLRERQAVKRAVETFVALHLSDFRIFFEHFHTMTVLEKAIVLRHLPRVWIRAVEMLNKSFGKQERIPILHIGSWLALSVNDSDALAIERLCQAMNIHVERAEPIEEVSKNEATASSWEQLGDTTTITKKPSSTLFVRFKLQPLNTDIDASCRHDLLRSIANGCVSQQEREVGSNSAEIVMGIGR